MRRQIQFTLGATFFALLLVYGGVRFERSLALLGMESEPGWLSRQAGSQVRVGQLGSIQSANFLRVGDEVLAVNGQQIKRASEIADVFHNIGPETPYTVLIRRNGTPVEIRLTSQAVPLLTLLVNGAARLVIPNIFLLTGLIVFML